MFRKWRRLKPRSIRRSRLPGKFTRSLTSGPKNSASAGMASTAPSHRYIATRGPRIAGRRKLRRIISCHLGGSCSICAIEDGKCVANSFGMTAQSGLPHNNRVGDFDTFALLEADETGPDAR